MNVKTASKTALRRELRYSRQFGDYWLSEAKRLEEENKLVRFIADSWHHLADARQHLWDSNQRLIEHGIILK